MSDRTSAQLLVYSCPTKRRVVSQIVGEYLGYGGQYEGPGGDEPGEIDTGEQYTTDETRLGTMDELAGRLIGAAPRCSFIGWEDPKYEHLGAMVAYTPRLGRFDGECDASGAVVLDAAQIREAIRGAARVGPMYLARPGGHRRLLSAAAPDDIRRRGVTLAGYDMIQAAIEVACGIPWMRDSEGADVPRRRARMWRHILDARAVEMSQARHDKLRDLAGCLDAFGWPGWAAQILAAPPARLPAIVRQAADSCEADLRTAAWAPAASESDGLPWQLRAWATAADAAFANHRRR